MRTAAGAVPLDRDRCPRRSFVATIRRAENYRNHSLHLILADNTLTNKVMALMICCAVDFVDLDGSGAVCFLHLGTEGLAEGPIPIAYPPTELAQV